jgi:nucleoside-diphosphate-sugar epimerase
MRVFVAGATGAVGRPLVPMLVEKGHEVLGLARSAGAAEEIAGLAGTPVTADALDREAVVAAIARVRPEAVVHQLTAIPSPLDPKHIDAEFRLTNRLRTEGTRNLLDGWRAAGGRLFVAQSIAFAYDPEGRGLRTEDDPLWRRPPRTFAGILEAIRDLESRVTAAGGAVLRYGHLYGPGTQLADDGANTARVRAGRFPVVGSGEAVFSFTHVDDAAGAAVRALETGVRGVFNVVDDDPAPVREWLPELARQLGAPAPGHVPTAAAEETSGEWGVAYLTRLAGASNARARQAMGWRPIHPSWRRAMVAQSAGGRH